MILAEKDGRQLTDNELTDAIKEYANILDIDLKDCSSSQFSAILRRVSSEYISTPLQILRLPGPKVDYNYNYDYIYNMSLYYIDICNMYNKAISIDGFCVLCDLDPDYIATFEGEELTSIRYKIFKNIFRNRENFIKNKCIDSNNITGAIAVGNTEYKWNGGSTGNTTINIVSGSDLPNLLQGLQAQPLPAPKE